MARESEVAKNIIEKLKTMSGVRVYEQVFTDKWNTYGFDYIGLLAIEDSREVIGLEDDSAFSNRGIIDLFFLVGCSVKKQNNGKANLREALAGLCEEVEAKLTNYVPPRYESPYGKAFFTPVHFVSSQAATYNDDETKGISLMNFRLYYYKD